MTLSEFLSAAYAWALANQLGILLAAVLVPVAGTVFARLGKAGTTDKDGRVIASIVVGVGILGVVLEVLGLLAATALFRRSVSEAAILLLVAPPLCLAGCLVGIRWVFPLNELASIRTVVDVGAFLAACCAVLWLLGKFRGWGILLFGDVSALVVFGTLGFVLLRRLYVRAFRRRAEPS
ncbi:MAG: hypothetical protein V2A73_03290 [Pseudomonadota bacterium]